MKRSDAIQLGLFFYRTGKPCKHGHVCDRYTKTSACVECVKKQSSAWRIANPDKHKAAVKKWWENNKPTHNARVKKWQSSHPDKVREMQRDWAKANPDKVKLKTAVYRAKNKSKVTAWAVTAQIRRKQRVPKWLKKEDFLQIRAAYAMSKHLTEITGTVWEVDHVIPLQGAYVSGLHTPANLQVVPKDANRKKRNHFLA